MPQVNGPTLMMAIQAVDAKITTIEEALELDDSDAAFEYEQQLLGYQKALAELRGAYEEAVETTSNLPPYERLIVK